MKYEVLQTGSKGNAVVIKDSILIRKEGEERLAAMYERNGFELVRERAFLNLYEWVGKQGYSWRI